MPPPRRRPSLLLPSVIVLVVGLLAAGSGVWLYRAKRPPELRVPADQMPAADGAGAEALRVLGKADAPVTLEEFADMQCPPCGKMAEPVKQLERDYRGRLRVIFRHLPLPTHANARDAAFAAEAAGLQGRFWEMHSLLFQEQAVWSQAPEVRALFESYAGALGLDVARFRQDLASEAVRARVAADEKRATTLGVATTPTFFLNGVALAPGDALRPERLRALVDAAVKPKPKPGL